MKNYLVQYLILFGLCFTQKVWHNVWFPRSYFINERGATFAYDRVSPLDALSLSLYSLSQLCVCQASVVRSLEELENGQKFQVDRWLRKEVRIILSSWSTEELNLLILIWRWIVMFSLRYLYFILIFHIQMPRYLKKNKTIFVMTFECESRLDVDVDDYLYTKASEGPQLKLSLSCTWKNIRMNLPKHV